MARALSLVGRGLILAGVLVLAFVAYQLWGTSLAEARAQRDLAAEFDDLLAAAPEPAPLGADAADAAPSTTVPPEESATDPTEDPTVGDGGGTELGTLARFAPPPPPAEDGSAVARIRIPTIDLERVIVSGVGVDDLKRGPGHYPGTPLPGQPGNAALAGHRTTYGAPFGDLDRLSVGDTIFVTTVQGEFTYEVTGSEVVAPDRIDVLAPTEDDRLTLTTCHPKFTARERLIVVAELVTPTAPAPPPVDVVADGDISVVAGGVGTDDPGTGAEAAAPDGDDVVPDAEALGGDLSGDPTARLPAFAWGLAAAVVWALGWAAGERWGRVPAYAAATPVFVLVLWQTFENVARLLPANI